uniref:Uncharacterized LOC100185840 n=1 Tax=Ciona intestinalis TaxID=7719 RepID=F6YWT5_CIOIN|nr:uncharacterized protein LOC100185840 [Ciona intestinalis]|eukprot:XP_002126127.3 uncharacterized protein LOC100185840 [Ciona intestinalis]
MKNIFLVSVLIFAYQSTTLADDTHSMNTRGRVDPRKEFCNELINGGRVGFSMIQQLCGSYGKRMFSRTRTTRNEPIVTSRRSGSALPEAMMSDDTFNTRGSYNGRKTSYRTGRRPEHELVSRLAAALRRQFSSVTKHSNFDRPKDDWRVRDTDGPMYLIKKWLRYDA